MMVHSQGSDTLLRAGGVMRMYADSAPGLAQYNFSSAEIHFKEISILQKNLSTEFTHTIQKFCKILVSAKFCGVCAH